MVDRGGAGADPSYRDSWILRTFLAQICRASAIHTLRVFPMDNPQTRQQQLRDAQRRHRQKCTNEVESLRSRISQIEGELKQSQQEKEQLYKSVIKALSVLASLNISRAGFEVDESSSTALPPQSLSPVSYYVTTLEDFAANLSCSEDETLGLLCPSSDTSRQTTPQKLFTTHSTFPGFGEAGSGRFSIDDIPNAHPVWLYSADETSQTSSNSGQLEALNDALNHICRM